MHVLHDPLTPMHSNSTLADQGTRPEGLAEQSLDSDRERKDQRSGGTYADGALTAQVRSFGSYTVMVDTIAPVIENVDLRADMTGRSNFTLKVTDDLSGIDNWKATIDGAWVLMEYEPKNNSLTHTFDEHTKAPGKKAFKLEVTDDRRNTARYELTFTH
ncbi:MAG: hypothetical protein R2818_10315 [Flavobacteriales bacterium]